MRPYVANLPEELVSRIVKINQEIISLIFKNNIREAEELLKKQYELFISYEQDLPEGQRYHKGSALHNWGVINLLQDNQQGYNKILLAYIEDLLDYDSFDEANNLPAYEALINNPSISDSLLSLVRDQVNKRIKNNKIPKNPEDVLHPFSNQAQKEIQGSPDVTIDQIKPTIVEWLNKKGDREKRVFVGGNYRNIALLRYIADRVEDFDFFSVMPLELPETATSSNLIHDISIEMLKECSFAIFEVTISNGHLMEIERARDFKHLKVILVYQLIKHTDPPTITRMALTLDFEKESYRNFSELTSIIRDFLPKT